MKGLKSQGHREGRGCPCERCENRRIYARNRYAAEKQGKVYSKVRETVTITTRNREDKDQEPRLVETIGPGETQFHWMPKEGWEWQCPVCPATFLKSKDGEWSRQP